MTGLTKSHEVTPLIASAFGEWEDVVYLFSRSESTLLLTFFTERMSFDVSVSDSLPSTTVSFVGLWVSLIPIVVFVYFLLMLGTVLVSFSKPTTSGVGTGTFWFVGHSFTSLSGHKKSHPGFLRDSFWILFLYSNSIKKIYEHLLTFPIIFYLLNKYF